MLKKFNEICKQYFIFKSFRRMPIVLAIIMFIVALPLTICFLSLAAFAYSFLLLIKFMRAPYDFLRKLLKEDVKDIHFLPQTVVYMVGYPVLFFGHVLHAIYASILFGIYFNMNIVGFLGSMGGIEVKPFLFDEFERNLEVPHEKSNVNKIVALVFVVIFSIFTFVSLVVRVIANGGDNAPTYQNISKLVEEYGAYNLSNSAYMSGNISPYQHNLIINSDTETLKIQRLKEYCGEYLMNTFAGNADRAQLIYSSWTIFSFGVMLSSVEYLAGCFIIYFNKREEYAVSGIEE